MEVSWWWTESVTAFLLMVCPSWRKTLTRVVGCHWRPNSQDFLYFCLCNESLIPVSDLFHPVPDFLRMHTARSPSSIPTGVPGDALDLILSGSQLSIAKRPSSASPGKYFSRSVSVSVASESRGKRNTLVRGAQQNPTKTIESTVSA